MPRKGRLNQQAFRLVYMIIMPHFSAQRQRRAPCQSFMGGTLTFRAISSALFGGGGCQAGQNGHDAATVPVSVAQIIVNATEQIVGGIPSMEVAS